MAREQPRIIIVGAGMAGLSAAARLAEQGLTNFTILEAAERIGGRIHTVSIDEGPYPIELGANWIQGATKDNPCFELAEKLGILSPYRLNNRFSCRMLREDGSEIDQETTKEAWQTFQKIQRKLRSTVPIELNKSRLSGKPNLVSIKSVLDKLIETELYEYSQKHPNSRGKIADIIRAFNTMTNHLLFHEGDELEKVAWEDDFEDLPGGDVHIPRGYNQLLVHLMGRIQQLISSESRRKSSDYLRLNAEVIKLRMQQNGHKIEATIKNGEVVTADHVIVTCSLGYLKKNHASLFNPSLPAEKISVIERMGFGRVDKIFLEFDRPITSPTYRNIAFAWDHTNIGSDKSEWFRQIFGFDQLFTRDTTLLGWVSGDGAEHMETLSDGEIADTCVKLLRMFLRDASIPYPKKVLVSRWCSNPYILGCYSYTTPKLKAGDNKALIEPVCSVSGEPKIMFAGEATMKDYGYVHGAQTSGIREAERLCNLYHGKHAKSRL